MDKPAVVPVVLSGGAGTRLWPASRPDTPKQLLALVDDRTMLQATLDRVAGIEHRHAPVVVCSAAQEGMVRSELLLAGDGDGLIILEPVGRNTAPAAAVAALALQQTGEDHVLLVMPADHVITDIAAFHEAVAKGASAAAAGHLATFGIVPDHPATGYGYIERGSPEGLPESTYQLNRFVEKPDRETAAGFISDGSYLWNSGMFMFRASVYVAELEQNDSEMAAACRGAVRNALTETSDGAATLRLGAEAFAKSPSNSIDYAVMEHTTTGVVIPLDAGWSDVGSWASLHELAVKDADGNAVAGDVVQHGVVDSYLRGEGPLLAVVGVSDIIAVSTPDAVLVAHRDRSEDVREIVAKLNEHGRSESVRAKRSPTAWGSMERISLTAERTADQLTIESGHVVTVKADVAVVMEGSVTCDGVAGAAGSSWDCSGNEVTLHNNAEATAIVLVVHEG